MSVLLRQCSQVFDYFEICKLVFGSSCGLNAVLRANGQVSAWYLCQIETSRRHFSSGEKMNSWKYRQVNLFVII
jgi:hypothetical protein